MTNIYTQMFNGLKICYHLFMFNKLCIHNKLTTNND